MKCYKIEGHQATSGNLYGQVLKYGLNTWIYNITLVLSVVW